MNKEYTCQFFLKEYEYLTELTKATDLNNALNQHLKINTLFVGLLPVLSSLLDESKTKEVTMPQLLIKNFSNQPGSIPPNTIIIILFIFLIVIYEVVLFKRMVELSIRKAPNTRSLNRVRRYFWNLDNEILPYLSLPIVDTEPPFVLSYKVKSAMIINTAMGLYASYIIVDTVWLKINDYIEKRNLFLIIFLIETVIAMAVFLIQKVYSDSLLKKAQRNYTLRWQNLTDTDKQK